MRHVLVPAIVLTALLVLSATAFADSCAPAKVTDLVLGGTGKNSAMLTFTDPGDDCDTGTAASYEIRRSTSAITEANYYSATVFLSLGPAGPAGTSDCGAGLGLTCNTTYYFAITFTDAAGNRSPVSNCVSGATKGCGTTTQVACP